MSDFDRLATSLRETYRLKSTLGTGGMAHVFAAEDLRTGRSVAIKALREERTTPVSIRRFLGEIRLTAQLEHPNIVPLYDTGTADGLPYYVMPFIEGSSLRARLQRMGRLPLDEVVRIIEHIAAALDYAHEQRVIHRDIKPENVLLQAGRALIFDFGIALPFDDIELPRATVPRTILGTPAYVSPEHIQGEELIDGRSDVYSLGCMAYEMICGYPPITGDSASAILRRHVSDIPLPLYCRMPGISSALSAAVVRALAKRPEHRFATPGSFAEAIRGGLVEQRCDDRSIARETSSRPAVAIPPAHFALRETTFLVCETMH
jgi:serine/threonine-protein kinase